LPTLFALRVASVSSASSVRQLTRHTPSISPKCQTHTLHLQHNNNERQQMTLDEYKQMVEAQRLTSLAIALDALRKSDAIAKEMNK
jgi:hypothetical protein